MPSDERGADPVTSPAKPRIFSSAEGGWTIGIVLAYVLWRLGSCAVRVATSPIDPVGEGVMFGFVLLVGGTAFFVIRRSKQRELERQRQLDAWRSAGERADK